MKECVTHHYACDCREKYFLKKELLYVELIETISKLGLNDEQYITIIMYMGKIDKLDLTEFALKQGLENIK